MSFLSLVFKLLDAALILDSQMHMWFLLWRNIKLDCRGLISRLLFVTSPFGGYIWFGGEELCCSFGGFYQVMH